MPDKEKVIKELHDARRYLEDKEWSDRGVSPHIDAIINAIALLKEQQSNIKYWSAKYDEMGKQYMAVRDERDELLKEQEPKAPIEHEKKRILGFCVPCLRK